MAAQLLTPNHGRKAVDKGPRALGLVQLSASGKKGRLIPIVIMMDGKFFDAGSYKASPVPMALDFNTVYEGFRTGVSQGIFTITQPGQLNHVWIAEGTWLPDGLKAPEKSKKYSTPVIADDDKDGPPVLHRRVEKSDSDSASDAKKNDKNKDDKSKDQPTATTPAATSTTTPSATPAGGVAPATESGKAAPATPPDTKPDAKPDAKPDSKKTDTPAETAKAPADDETIQDPNRPRLRRGKPDASAHHEPFTTFEAALDAPTAAAVASNGKTDAKPALDVVPPPILIPAISDAAGPDPRPYLYEVKPVEEAIYRNKMLELAAQLVRANQNASSKSAAPQRKAAAAKSGAKVPKPDFDYVNMHIFDLSNSNEPVLVLSAKTHPVAASGTGSSEEPKEITLIARTNLEGELQKLFFAETDSRHLYSSPRMELIDAVDADGDGRGELLFRRTFEEGSAYAIYRVTPDGLWPLFEGTP